MEVFLNFLSPFEQATNTLEEQHYPSISLIIPTVAELVQLCEMQIVVEEKHDIDHDHEPHDDLVIEYMG